MPGHAASPLFRPLRAGVRILAYLDFGGATGTCKDGVAEAMLAFATERGDLKPGMPVVEASSGSFGAALAVACATTGHDCILVVPSRLPAERKKHLQNLGARIVACNAHGRKALEHIAADTAARYGAITPTTLPMMTTRSITAGSPGHRS